MKKLFLILLTVGLFASCQKKSPNAPAKTQAVSFGVQKIDPSSLKDNGNDTILCQDAIPDMAWIQINGVDYYAQLTTVDGKLYTQSIQLSPGTYHVDEFVLYKETDGIEGPTGADPIVYGTPKTGSAFAIYVTNPLSFNIDVSEFAKTEVPVEVLCFTPDEYMSFGYDWFVIDRIVVREQCFFGDFCTKHYLEYAGTDYARQSTGLQLDMPAIFQIKGFVKSGNGEWGPLPGGDGGVFTNDNADAGFGVGAPVCVQYPDKLGVTDSLKFELYILVKQGASINFVLFHTWLFADAEMIPAGDDGVVDFELGNCNVGSADLQLPPYMNLPATCTLKVGAYNPSHATGPDGQKAYMDVALTGIGSGYDIGNNTYAAFCADRDIVIYPGTNYPMNVFSSLYPMQMTSHYAQNIPWNKINYLFNHLADFAPYTWQDVQQAVWMLEGENGAAHSGLPAITQNGIDMVDAANLLGGSFVPGPGDLAAILFESTDDTEETVSFQLVIIRIDP